RRRRCSALFTYTTPSRSVPATVEPAGRRAPRRRRRDLLHLPHARAHRGRAPGPAAAEHLARTGGRGPARRRRALVLPRRVAAARDRKSTRLNSIHVSISY